jgi:histidinol-phosphatase (PHP family)
MGANVRMDPGELPAYVADILHLREQYRGRLAIRLGIELDFVEGVETFNERILADHPWDYVLGSVHYLDPECRIPSWPRNYAGDVHALYETYFAQIRKMARSGLIDIVAHFDVAKRCGTPHGAAERAAITAALEEIARCDLALEINTSGYRHPELQTREPYPDFDILRQAIALGIPLMVNSDAHAPAHLGTEFVEVERRLRDLGCRSLVRYENRRRLTYPLESAFEKSGVAAPL